MSDWKLVEESLPPVIEGFPFSQMSIRVFVKDGNNYTSGFYMYRFNKWYGINTNDELSNVKCWMFIPE